MLDGFPIGGPVSPDAGGSGVNDRTTTSTTLAEALWLARTTGRSVNAVTDLSLVEGLEVLSHLTARRVQGGDPIVGWKIARLPGPAHPAFVGPVFASSLSSGCLAHAVRARVEVEFVARFDQALSKKPFDASSLSWHVGLELIDNHDPDWNLAAGWAAADWGLQVGVVLGDPCGPPPFEVPVGVDLTLPIFRLTEPGRWRVGLDMMIELLRRDCPQLARPCEAGDLVWTGALIAPRPVAPKASISVTVEGFGTVTFERP